MPGPPAATDGPGESAAPSGPTAGLRVCWYWPYLRDEHLPLVTATQARLGGALDVLTVAGRRPAAPLPAGVRVLDVLPDVPTRAEGSLGWLWSRLTVYPRRSAARARAVRNGGYDLVHVVFANRFTDGAALARLGRRVALVVSVHDAVPHDSRLPGPLERALLRLLYRRGERLVVHHHTVAEALGRDFGIGSARLREVPHWVLPVDAAPRDQASPARRVLAFGALRRNKGIETVIEAARLLGPTARVTVAGRGAQDVEALVHAAAVRDEIDAEVGYVEVARKDELYRNADVVVLAYTSFASQSGVLHDAYAHGRPVVVTDVGALGPSVRAEGTGRVVAPGDPGALAEAIAGLLDDPAEWAAAAAATRSCAQDRSPEAFAVGLVAVYREARAAFATRHPRGDRRNGVMASADRDGLP